VPERIRKKRPKKPVVKKKANVWKKAGWMICGFDVSMSSIAGAAIAFDSTLRRILGPATVIHRYTKDDDYFQRMLDVSKAHNFIQELQKELKVVIEPDDVHIAIEEPWAFGQIRAGFSNALKQQAQISGSFMGGLLRYGFSHIFEINNQSWRKLVADDLGITTHHTKWKDPALTQRFNCAPDNTGKFRAKQWVLDIMNHDWNIPDWPDLVQNSKLGLIPRPENSKAKATQSDDRYEALAMMQWLRQELKKGGLK
jgi:hypothetical protein